MIIKTVTVNKAQYRVLVVDDHPPDLEYFTRVLRRSGFRVEGASSAEEAQGLMRRESFAVLITDLWMPGMNGDELGRWAKDEYPGMEVIIVTAEGSVDTASKAVRFGASDYLSKPLERDKVLESLGRALEKYQERTRSSEQLQQLQILSDSMSDILNRLPQGVILVTGDCRVVQMNHAAKKILQEKDGLQIGKQSRLVAHNADDSRALRQRVDEATRPDDNPEGSAMTLLRPGSGATLTVMVTPTDPGMSSPEEEPLVSVFVVQPETPPLDVGVLAKLYSMTPAEAKLASHLAVGRSLDQSSQAWGVSLSTVRTHLKRIFTKTETSRQGDLVHKLLTGPAMLSSRRDDEPED